jgi:hypothetical protein
MSDEYTFEILGDPAPKRPHKDYKGPIGPEKFGTTTYQEDECIDHYETMKDLYDGGKTDFLPLAFIKDANKFVFLLYKVFYEWQQAEKKKDVQKRMRLAPYYIQIPKKMLEDLPEYMSLMKYRFRETAKERGDIDEFVDAYKQILRSDVRPQKKRDDLVQLMKMPGYTWVNRRMSGSGKLGILFERYADIVMNIDSKGNKKFFDAHRSYGTTRPSYPDPAAPSETPPPAYEEASRKRTATSPPQDDDYDIPSDEGIQAPKFDFCGPCNAQRQFMSRFGYALM